MQRDRSAKIPQYHCHQNPPYDSPALSRLGSSVASTGSTPTDQKFNFLVLLLRPISDKALFLICFSSLAFFISERDLRESSLANSVEFGHMAMLFPAKQAKLNFNIIFYLSRLSTCCRRACIGHLIYLIWWQTANKGLFCWFSTKWIWLSYYMLSWIGWETQRGCSKRYVTNMVSEPGFCQPWVWEEVSFRYMPTVWQKDLMTND